MPSKFVLSFARVSIPPRSSPQYAARCTEARNASENFQKLRITSPNAVARIPRTQGKVQRIFRQFRPISGSTSTRLPKMANEVIHEPEQCRFIIKYADIDEPAFLSYVLSEDKTVYNIHHTYTPPSLRGKGIAGKLVKHAVAYVRENEHKIIPTCSYVAAYMERHPEDKDVLKRD